VTGLSQLADCSGLEVGGAAAIVCVEAPVSPEMRTEAHVPGCHVPCTSNGLPCILVQHHVSFRYESANESMGVLRSDLQRLQSKATSPVITLYHDTINAVTMVRA
jgi:hypothetical protein